MAAVIFKEMYLKQIRSALKRQFPDVKSSHIAEALAAAVGRRTHAALLVDIRGVDTSEPETVPISESKFLDRLRLFGYSSPGWQLDFFQLLPVERVREKVIVETAEDATPSSLWGCFNEAREWDIKERNEWYEKCQFRNVPCVNVSVRRKYAKVDWDHFSIHPDLDHKLSGSWDTELKDAVEGIFERYANKKSTYQYSALVGYFDNLFLDDARAAATEIFKLLQRVITDEA